MKIYFQEVHKAAMKHAADEFPKESCGIVVDSIYYPCKNIAENPETDFRIHHNTYMKYERMGNIDSIIHSHNDFAGASKNDMAHQISSGVPWGMVNVINGAPQEVLFWGDELPEVQDFFERPFVPGIYDCFGLVRDIYRVMYEFELPNTPREWDFWNNPSGESHFEEELAWMVPDEFNFINKDDGLEDGDSLLFKFKNGPVWNHCGIYIGNGIIAHHLENKLSRREPISNWMTRIDAVIRPTHMRKTEWN